MKPHKNAKVSHYNTGKPWDDHKPKAPKKLEEPEYAEVTLTTVDGTVVVKVPKDAEKASWVKVEEPEYAEIWVAKAAKPNVHIPHGNVEYVEGEKFVVQKRRVLKNHERSGMGFFTRMAMLLDDGFFDTMWHIGDRFIGVNKFKLRENVEEFLNQPDPEPERSSLLILPPEVKAQQRRDLQKERFAEFLEKEVEEQLEPVKKEVDRLRNHSLNQSSRIVHLDEEKTRLEEELSAMRLEIEKLQNYKARVDTSTASIGERTRYFRAED